MTAKKQVLAICGSTRKASSNLALINAIGMLTIDEWQLSIYQYIDALPHYNPDLDNETPPPTVIDFRNRLKTADGIFICTPEYAMGLPGSLKNALDWTVSSMEFSGKPVLAITASTSGEKAHQSLLGTLHIIEAQTEGTELLISFIKTKVDNAFRITDEDTLQQIKKLIINFTEAMATNT